MTSSPLSRSALILGVTVIAGACATRTTMQPTAANRSFSPVCVEGVATFDDFNSVPSDYYEVAYIQAEQNSVYTDKGQMITAMRKRAAEQGGNGLVVNSVNKTKVGVKVLGAALGSNSAERQGKAVAIFIPADSMRVKNACGKS